MSDVFHFKQFDVTQDKCAMKIGTDGVLLGAIASTDRLIEEWKETGHTDTFNVLDIGTGTGLLALMTAQRLSETGAKDFIIDAIDIDENAATQATENCARSTWSNNICVRACSLSDFATDDTDKKYSLIICNPPFYNSTLKPENEARAAARHKDSLPMGQIMNFASNRLTENGRLAVIYPNTYDQEVMTAATISGLNAVMITDIITKAGSPSKRRICEFAIKAQVPDTRRLLIRNADNGYSDEYRQLTNQFYVSLR